MNIDNETIDGCMVCRFTGALTIWEAADTWHQLRPLIDTADALAIDLTGVDECDAAGIQILCQTWQAVRQRGKRCRIETISEPVFAAMQLAGMDSQFLFKTGQGV